MNEQPQETRMEEQEDLLERIITHGLEQTKAPVDETPPVPKQEDGGGTTPPEEKKNRRSSVYLYLLVLFGAAFLMLLLAYFVQQRSSEDTISDLRNSMNLSRQELLDEIKKLEEENKALGEELDRLNGELSQLQEQYEEKDDELTFAWNSYDDVRDELYWWNSFWTLEQYYQAEDYERCAAVLLLQAQSEFSLQPPKGTEERQAEIVRAVIDRGILDEDYEQHPDDYSDLLDAYFSDIDNRLSESGMVRGWINDVSRETER